MCTDGNHSAVLTMQTDQSLFQRSGLCTESSHSSVLTTQTAQSLLQRPGLCTERSHSSVLTATENWTVYGKQSGRCPCLRDLDYVRRAVIALSLRLRRHGLCTERNQGSVPDLDYVRRAVIALSLRLRRPGLCTERNQGSVPV